MRPTSKLKEPEEDPPNLERMDDPRNAYAPDSEVKGVFYIQIYNSVQK